MWLPSAGQAQGQPLHLAAPHEFRKSLKNLMNKREGGETQRRGLASVRSLNRAENSSPPLGAGLGVALDKPNTTIKGDGDRAKKCQIMPFANIYRWCTTRASTNSALAVYYLYNYRVLLLGEPGLPHIFVGIYPTLSGFCYSFTFF